MWLVEDGLCLFLFVPAAVDFVPLVASTCFVVFCCVLCVAQCKAVG